LTFIFVVLFLFLSLFLFHFEGNGTGALARVGREAAVLFDATHTIANNAHLVPTTLISNFAVAAFRDAANFGVAASPLGESNGRAFLFAGDSGLVDVSGFAMNNEKNGDTHLVRVVRE
jgi:hypothetical protein